MSRSLERSWRTPSCCCWTSRPPGSTWADARTWYAGSVRLADDRYAPALVLVTHHVEEVPPGFTHGLLLREGRVVAGGPLADVLTDAALSEAFGLPLTVEQSRWPLVCPGDLGRSLLDSGQNVPRIKVWTSSGGSLLRFC